MSRAVNDRANAPLLASSNTNQATPPPAQEYQTIPPPEDYYYIDDYDSGDNDFTSTKHFSRHKYTYWIAIALISLPLLYAYFQIVMGIEANYVDVPDLVRVDTIRPIDSPSYKLGRRVILVGDVHGKIKSLKLLLAEVEYDSTKDRLVLLGDMISKGPNSIAVLDYAISVNASCVRGNHEDSILKQYANIHHLPQPNSETGNIQDKVEEEAYFVRGDDKRVARKLRPEHIEYLGTCPAIMELGAIGFHGTRAVAVHAGLQWNIEKLKDQDPEVVFTMRSLLPPHYTKPSIEMEGVHWSKIWNKKQKEKDKSLRMSVFYGHDARNGLNLGKYTAGLDTGCVSGGKLTAMVVSETTDGSLSHEVTSVRC